MKPIDFQGIISLDLVLVEQLRLYLQEKESQLSQSIANAIHPLPREGIPPVLASGDLKLFEGVETFTKNIHKVSISKYSVVAPNDWELATRQINNALWENVEVLEGCVVELFRQLGQVGFEKWNPALLKAVEAIKDMLHIRLEELGWKIPRLESLLWDYRWICEKQDGKIVFFKKTFSFWKSILDRELMTSVKKSRKLLETGYKKFVTRYTEYEVLKIKIDNTLRKFNSYQVFKSLDEANREEFRTIYRLLKVWELNLRSKSLPPREPIRALRNAYSIEKAASVFREYSRSLRKVLFDRSRKIKADSNELYFDVSSRRIVGDVVKGYRAEVHTLGAAIDKYREFYLRTHPNPYVRTRWGFAEWIVGPEPSQTKDLLSILYSVEELDKLYESLGLGLQKGPAAFDSLSMSRLYQDMEQTLHEMGQPLTSRMVMRARAEKLLDQIQQMDELGSFNPDVVEYVGKAFSKGLRADWQYNVFFDIPLFHQLYEIHQGILGPIEDRNHLGRKNKFRDLITQIEGWVRNRDTHRHVHEIETDMTDMKNYLQEFLAYVQRIENEKDLSKVALKAHTSDITRQLLEYRYLFGQFFHDLHQYEPEGKMIRNQFLFIDQYLESVENKLNELKLRWQANV
jgi:hypothetical protein